MIKKGNIFIRKTEKYQLGLLCSHLLGRNGTLKERKYFQSDTQKYASLGAIQKLRIGKNVGIRSSRFSALAKTLFF